MLFEVASLEREATLQHEACLRHLATSVRSSYKIHAFAGGFEQEQTELFDKVEPPEGPQILSALYHQGQIQSIRAV